jgi:arylformamidase
VAYGETEVETLDIYRTDRPKAPIFLFIHGGTWRFGSAWEYGYPAEMFVKAGAHYWARIGRRRSTCPPTPSRAASA